MKTIVSFIAILMLAVTSFAQSGVTGIGTPVSDQNTYKSDTTADATTDTQTLKLGGAWKKVSVHIIGKEISGTAAITFTVEVSNDGVYFTTHPTADTVAFTNTTSGVFQSKVIEVDNYAYTHIRIKGVGSGTQSTLWYCRLKWAGPI